jgi:hypothetical protein
MDIRNGRRGAADRGRRACHSCDTTIGRVASRRS